MEQISAVKGQIRDPSDGLGCIWSAGRELRDQDGRSPGNLHSSQIFKNIKRQINEIAALYDWDMEVNTTDPSFYKWTQWIFVQMFKKGLAYEKEFPINWCPSCKTGLANEEVVNGCCERCGSPVTKKNLRQWMLEDYRLR